MSEHLKWFWRGCGIVVFDSDAGVETVGIRAGPDCGMRGGRGINSTAMSGLCRVKYGTYSKKITSANTKYLLVDGL